MAEGKKIALGIGIGCGVVVLIGIIGAVLCVGVCGAGIGAVAIATEGAVHEGEAYFADLRANNVEAAYNRMAQSYRGAHDLNAFRAAIARSPILTQQRGASFAGRNISSMNGRTTATLNGQLTGGPTGVVPFQLLLLQQGEVWRIEQVSIQGQPLQ